MTTILCLAQSDGGLQMSDYQRATFRQFVKDNADKRIRLKLERVTPESRNQRKFLHGAIYPLWAYLDGKDYKSTEILENLHEVAKLEFNTHIFVVGGQTKKIGKSTKGELNKGFLEKVIDYLVDNYGIDPSKVLNPDHYKKFRDEIWSFTTKYDTYIDYLRELKII